MKPIKGISALLAAVLVLSFSACGAPRASELSAAPSAVMDAILASEPDAPEMHRMIAGEKEFSDYLSGYYQMENASPTDGVICYAGGASAEEIAVLAFPDAKKAAVGKAALETYLKNRAGDFTGYLPEQAALAERGRVVVRGKYAALLICRDSQKAENVFAGFFGGEASGVPSSASESGEISSLPQQKPGSGSLDASGILSAFRSGNESSLPAREKAVLSACRQALREAVKEPMTDYEKELAVHDWLLGRASYDFSANDHSPDARPSPDNQNPYGLLIDGRAICEGYASTFQLLMDMLDIECLTVSGTSHGGTERHAWNMVRLEGDWYCVDVTWDDPAGNQVSDETSRHAYFNVTSQFLRKTDHQWQYGSVPEASADKYKWNAGGKIRN